MQHFDAVTARIGRAAGRYAKRCRLGVGGLDRTEVTGVVEFGKGVFELGQGVFDGAVTGDARFGLGDLGFEAFFFGRFFGVHQTLGQAFHVDAGAGAEGANDAAGGHGVGRLGMWVTVIRLEA